MGSAIHPQGLVKHFGDLMVLDGIDLRRAGHRWIIVVGLRWWRWARGLDDRGAAH
jgi:hypothetical protein